MDYYISDTHFGHENIIRYCDRPFASVAEMDKALIANWNARVRPDDHVWHLGDFAFRDGGQAEHILKQLNGHKHLIIGNHDPKGVLRLDNLSDYFETVDYAMQQVDGKKRRLWMCHYPLAEPPKNHWMLYGHIHNNKEGAYWRILSDMPNVLNCCVEITGYMPVTFDELVQCNLNWKHETPRKQDDHD